MGYLGYVEGLARVSKRWDEQVTGDTCSHLYRATFSQVGAPLCPSGWRLGVKGEISILRENRGGGGLCERCRKAADRLGPNPGIPGEGLIDDEGEEG